MPAACVEISKLFEPGTDVSLPVYLDTTSLKVFSLWAQDEEILKKLVTRIENDGLQLIVFEDQLEVTHSRAYEDAHEQLEVLGVEFNSDGWQIADDLFAAEVQEVYFHDEPSALANSHAKFLVLTRNAARNDPKLRVVSGHPSFQRLVKTEIFLLPSSLAQMELPANIDVFADLQLHQRLRDTISGYYHSRHYASAVFEAAKELFEHLRQASGATSDGNTLVNETVKIGTQWDGKAKKLSMTQAPNLPLNALASDEEIGEHEGYYYFIQGVTKAIRNSNAHLTAADPFIVSRFDDQKTAIKVLCFLSLLFEKIDKRVP